MNGKDAIAGRWSIGELARASGVTVRTLRHYDEIGLVPAGGRSASGHRRYTAADVRRLYQVRALRSLGMPLGEIRELLASAPEDPAAMRAVLTAQLRRLTVRAERTQRLIEQVGGLLRRLDEASMPDSDQFMTTLEMISMLDAYFTPEQREELAHRRDELGAEAVEQARTWFAELVEQLLGHMDEGTPAGDPRVRDLVRRWDELGAGFHAEGASGERTAAAARLMWQEHRDRLSAALPWPAEKMAGLPAYLERARAAG
ncbi:MerR family transcriptional regulator [Sphaerisporangium melleum]|uniref:MerR family transcriptional regulator n=1 Tax=Sphaerisporangium melleum TaxID=321316 RepID=A0A917R447_9ACTN|nr:MerR family transcriptional regulator [Sphaerisporangium melleum]GGK87928.1 MerR family transcriptional regulator [Sphaerisporangium melleum]GII74961.1 MerR family transcriptional regulator [Sphaerisporangium melleum]